MIELQSDLEYVVSDRSMASRSEKGAVPEKSPLFRQELLIAVVGMIRLNL